MTKTNKALADEMARYILEFEEDDFKYYCEPEERLTHIFLVAYQYINGQSEAWELLEELKKNDKV